MPSPDAKSQPYGRSDAYNDPDYASACPDGICDSYGLRILNSKNIMIYAAGLYVYFQQSVVTQMHSLVPWYSVLTAARYSFFKNYDVSCSSPDAPNGRRDCQNQIFSIEGDSSTQVFGLSEIGALQMLTIDRQDKASWSDNLGVYSNTIGYINYRI